LRKLKYLHAITEGYSAAMRADKNTFMAGEGIAEHGGCWAETVGLLKEFGHERIIDTPISESGFVGMCAGAAMCGRRSIANLMFMDFTTVCMDQIVNQAAKMSFLSAGQYKMPMTISGVYGVLRSGAAHHTQTFYPWFINIPGVKVVVPATPYDAKGLTAGAVMDDNLVMLFHHQRIMNITGDVPEEDYFLPLGQAEVVTQGTDVTIVAAGALRHRAFEAVEALSQKSISAELIDPRTLVPLDTETIIESVKKTGRLIIVDEAYSPCGFGAEVIAMVQENVFDYLDAPMKRLHCLSAPIPYAPALEEAILPSVGNIVNAATEMTKR
jgi:acetoin:2,6-dichlorophenolindophenol oxidoreductase subunit beta